MIYFKRYFPPIQNIEIIARRFSIRDLARLQRDYGKGNRRKLKGEPYVELKDDTIRFAELHWYEAHGIGKHEIKAKRFLD